MGLVLPLFLQILQPKFAIFLTRMSYHSVLKCRNTCVNSLYILEPVRTSLINSMYVERMDWYWEFQYTTVCLWQASIFHFQDTVVYSL